MPIHRSVKKALRRLPVDYEIVQTKDHYWLKVEGYERVMVGGNHPNLPDHKVKETVDQVNKLRKRIKYDLS